MGWGANFPCYAASCLQECNWLRCTLQADDPNTAQGLGPLTHPLFSLSLANTPFLFSNHSCTALKTPDMTRSTAGYCHAVRGCGRKKACCSARCLRGTCLRGAPCSHHAQRRDPPRSVPSEFSQHLTTAQSVGFVTAVVVVLAAFWGSNACQTASAGRNLYNTGAAPSPVAASPAGTSTHATLQVRLHRVGRPAPTPVSPSPLVQVRGQRSSGLKSQHFSARPSLAQQRPWPCLTGKNLHPSTNRCLCSDEP